MTNNNHPITPPPHLMLRWQEEARNEVRDVLNHFDRQSIQMIKAANWGWRQRDANVPNELQKARDEQLEACCDWLDGYESEGWAAEQMRNACRLKPKSQAEEALKAIGVPTKIGEARVIEHHAHELIRAALERLRELEEGQ